MKSVDLNLSPQTKARLIGRERFAKLVSNDERSFVRDFDQMTDADRANSLGLIYEMRDQEEDVSIRKFPILKYRA